MKLESQEASQQQETSEEYFLDELQSRAAERAEQTDETPAEETEVKETQHVESPEDNAEKSRLGRKLADMERKFVEQGQQLSQVIDIIQAFAQQAQAHQAQTQTSEQDPEYIPTETQEFVPFLEKKLESILERKMSKEQQSAHDFANNYIGYIEELASEEDDPAIAAAIKKLTTGPGEAHNKKHSNNPIADAGKNYQRAKKQILAAQHGKGDENQNPLKGGKPDSPLGAASGNTTKREVKTIPLSDSARRAASSWGHTGKELQEMMKE